MRFGLHLPNFAAFSDPRQVAELARSAEEAGWEGFFPWDHVVRSEGDFPLIDPWVTMGAIAQATERILLGPMVTPLSRRRPWNVARHLTTLDHLSVGRLIFGVGLGVTTGPELANFGELIDPKIRGDMLDEGLDILRSSWTGQPVDHHGQHYRVDHITFLPRPVRPGGIPIWAATERVKGRPVRRAAGLDGVFPFGLPPAALPELIDNVAAQRPAGIDGYEFVAAGTDDWSAWQSHGATWWLHVLPWNQPFEISQKIVAAGPPGS
jgi:alkanesulfonate monooxygenase SsuD/methylene tetrahydromethanopterin reductase-like flavin-dependent oxidoreductase (luciferase family)